MRWMFAMMTTLALAGPSLAVEINVSQIPYEHISDELSEPGETLDAFLVRVGPKLRAYSDRTGFEACGAIATNGTEHGVILGSSKSHLACAFYSAKRATGMRATGMGIHSHGGKAEFRQNRSDRMFMGLGDDARTVNNSRVYGQELNMFSETDHRLGRGYLATQSGVLYYDGQGNTTTVRGGSSANAVAVAP